MFQDRSPRANMALRRALAAEGGRFAKEARDALGLSAEPALHPDLRVDPAGRLDASSDEPLSEDEIVLTPK